jgi:hypothetical protein
MGSAKDGHNQPSAATYSLDAAAAAIEAAAAAIKAAQIEVAAIKAAQVEVAVISAELAEYRKLGDPASIAKTVEKSGMESRVDCEPKPPETPDKAAKAAVSAPPRAFIGLKNEPALMGEMVKTLDANGIKIKTAQFEEWLMQKGICALRWAPIRACRARNP